MKNEKNLFKRDFLLLMVQRAKIKIVFVSLASLFFVLLFAWSSLEVKTPMFSVTAATSPTEDFCGTKVDDSTRVELARTELARKQFSERAVPRDAVVNVYFHVIQDGNEGAVSDEAVAAQIESLNHSFRKRRISFQLISINRISNGSWFRGCDGGQEKKMKQALRIGTADDLNVYTCEPSKFIGRSSFPWFYFNDPLNDGIILHHGVMPGGSNVYLQRFTQTIVHETGHWMGLFHTFQGGCTGDGDYVDDTPAEAGPSFDMCPFGLDTCAAPGLDPTDNYMDYSGDACWTRFTDGQYSRMCDFFEFYRFAQ